MFSRSEHALEARRGPARMRHPRVWPNDLLLATGFLALGLGLVLPSYITGRMMPGDPGDARFNLAVLEYFYRTLSALLHGRAADFRNAPFFYPWPLVTNFSDTFWGDGEVYALARGLGANALVAFRIWFVAGYALTFILTFLSLRMLGLRSWGAAAGAFLFSFALPMTAQFSHGQLVYRLWVAPAVAALDRLLTRRDHRAGAACVLFLALQLAASIYLGLFLVLLLASYLAASLWVGRGRLAAPTPGSLRSAAPAGLVASTLILAAAIALLLVVSIPYRDVQALYGFGRSWPAVLNLLPRPGSYLLAGASTLWPNLSHAFPYPAVWEQQLFPGLMALIALLWFLISPSARRRHPLAVVMLVTTAILVCATINLHGHSLYWFIFRIPGFSAMRVVARVILVIMLPLSALLGLLVDDLIRSGERISARRALALAVSLLLVAECALVSEDASSPAAWQKRVATIEAQLPKHLPRDAVLVVKTPSRHADITAWTYGQIDAEIVAASLGIRTMNGYSGNFPPHWRTPVSCRMIGHDILAARHFMVEHGLPPPPPLAGHLVLVGFPACDTASLGAEPELALGHRYRFAAGGDGNAFVGDGFSFPERWGRWTDAKTAFLFFRLQRAPPGAAPITIEGRAFSAARDQKQIVTVTANNRPCGRFVLTDRIDRGRVVCPEGALRPGDNVLGLKIAHPARPIDLGLSRDRRHLGLGLQTLVVSESNDGETR